MCDAHGGTTIEIAGKTYHLAVSEELRASTLRELGATPPHDEMVDNLPLPSKGFWLRNSVRLLRTYRRTISPRLGKRCVYEPSCSRYCELALRQHGFIKGAKLTFGRLSRCRPGRGGTDIHGLEV